MKKALITGITGQDGSYLAELLLEKGYEVHGIKRRSSMFNTQRVDHIYEDPHVEHQLFKLHYGDLTDTSNITRLLSEIEPDEVYNLGAQSHVAVSFESPEYTVDVDGVGTLRILEGIRILGLEKKTALESLARGLGDPKRMLEERAQTLDNWADRLPRAAVNLTQQARARLNEASARLVSPREQLSEKRGRLENAALRLDGAMKSALQMQQARYVYWLCHCGR